LFFQKRLSAKAGRRFFLFAWFVFMSWVLVLSVAGKVLKSVKVVEA